jgi:hypothetical protein
MVYIESAFLGDEKDARDVSKVLRDKVVGSSIKVPVDNKLIPAFVVTNKTKLEKEDERKIRESAERMCGGADQQCMEAKTAELTQQVLITKSSEASSTANIVRGRRLTVTVMDENGKRNRIVVPEGQLFELDGISSLDPRKPQSALPTFDTMKNQIYEFATVVVVTFFWAFSVVATYALFARMGWGYGAWALALVAFMIPGSGYFIILGYFGFQSFVDKYRSMV